MSRLAHLGVAVGFALMVAALAVAPTARAVAQDAGAVDRVRVLHFTVDSLHPDEIGPLTPNLQSLKDQAVWWEQGRSVMASETLPNHVAMATGTYPERNGIPGNEGRAEAGDTERYVSQVNGEVEFGDPALLEVPSFARIIEESCPDLRTVHAFGKEYVDNIFESDPVDVRFPQETYNIPEVGLALDIFTTQAILDEINGEGFDYLFANLGDVDRAGHADASGFTGFPAFRNTVLVDTDLQVGRIVQALQDTGLWDSTVLVISSDHSMDFTNPADPSSRVNVDEILEGDERTAGKFFNGVNGSATFIYLLDPFAADAAAVLKVAMENLSAANGVSEVLYREPNPLDPGKDLATVHPDWHVAGTDRVGEIFLDVQSGFIVGQTAEDFISAAVNVAPGTHGSTATRHITAMVTGGWDGLASPTSIAASDPDAVDPIRHDDTTALPEQVEQVDFAPTYGWLLGVDDPGMGDGTPQWQGRVLEEAFTRRPADVCGSGDVAEPADDGTDGDVRPDGADVDGEPAPLPATGGGLVAGALLTLVAGAALRRRQP